MANGVSEWSFGQFIGWAAGGLVGCGVGAGTLDFVNSVGDFQMILFVTSISAMYGGIGGLIGGGVGYILAHFFHEHWAGWEMRSSFLVGLFLSLLIFSLLAFPSAPHQLPLLVHERLMIVAAFVAALVAAGLGGIINLLRESRTS